MSTPTLSPSSEIISFVLDERGFFPNNPNLPVLIYRSVWEGEGERAGAFESRFRTNDWGGCWRNGIYTYHHYHSTAHEVLGIAAGRVRVRLGGDEGRTCELDEGDAAVLPAGVAHKNLESSSNLLVIGAYPPGQQWDMNYGREGELSQARHNVAVVDPPPSDPLYGPSGPLMDVWEDAGEDA